MEKLYITASVEEFANCRGYLERDGVSYHVPDNVAEEIHNYAGFNRSVLNFFKSVAPEMFHDLFIRSFKKITDKDIIFLAEGDDIIGFTVAAYPPLLTSRFHTILKDLAEAYSSDIEVEECENSVAYMRKGVKEINGIEYQLGVLFTNDELNSVTCKLVANVGAHTFYLPSKYYNLSSARYYKTSENSEEACKILALRVIEDIWSEDWYKKLIDIDLSVNMTTKIKLTYEEYKQVVSAIKLAAVKSSMDEDDINYILDDLSRVDDFSENYPQLDDKKGSYIWRCSALSDNSIFDIIEVTSSIIESNSFYPQQEYDLRLILGDLLMNERIVNYLAKRRGSNIG